MLDGQASSAQRLPRGEVNAVVQESFESERDDDGCPRRRVGIRSGARGYPFSDPLSKPLMMKRWKTRAKAIGGITLTTPAVMMLTKFTSTSVANKDTTTVLV